MSLWLAIGAVLVVVEIMMPGYFLIVPAVAAWLTAALAIAAGLDGAGGQILLFAILSAGLFAVLFRPYRRLMRRGKPLIVNTPDRLVGQQGLIEQPIVAGRGKVRIADSLWLAAGPELPAGTTVHVVAVEGTVLTVAAG